jgi:hypothetical protein
VQKELGVTWDVELYGELLKIGGGKERYVVIQILIHTTFFILVLNFKLQLILFFVG